MASAKNAFDSGDNVEGLVRPVEQGQVKIPRGPCVDIPNPPPDYCPDTYSVDALFRIFEAAFRRSIGAFARTGDPNSPALGVTWPTGPSVLLFDATPIAKAILVQ